MTQFRNKAQGSAMFTLLAGIAITVAALYLLVKLASSGYWSDVADTTDSATQTRIMPSGRLVMGDGTEPGQRTGEQVFNKICLQCHAADSSIAYAPKITHNDQWAPRIAKGFETLVKNAINGYTGPEGGNMPAKGGAMDLTDEEVARAVAYMANQSGGQFTEPAVGGSAPAAASEASAPAASGAAPADTAAAGGKGKEVFDGSCFACHGATSAIPFAPKITKNDEWAPRIKQGKETLYKHAIEGYTNPKGGFMPAKGGFANLSDDDVKAAVDYMISQSGG